MKKYLLTALAVLAVAGFTCAQDISQARKAYASALYQQAADQFAPFTKSKDENISWEARLKTVLAYNYLGQFDNALKTIFSYPAAKDTLWNARALYIKASLLNYNNSIYESPDLEETQTDPTAFTYEQKEAEVKKAYSNLWDMRKDLVNFPSKQSADYLKINYSNLNPVLQPSLFDFFVNNWQNDNTVSKEKILEEAYSLGGKDRDYIREVWHTERLLMFTDYQDKKNNLLLAGCLDYASGLAEKCSPSKEMKPYLFTAKEIMGKAKAAMESAQIYLSAREYEKAANAADYCLKLPLNYFSQSCKDIKNNLERPMLSWEGSGYNITDVPSGEDVPLKVVSANVKNFYIHIFPLNAEEFSYPCNNYARRGKAALTSSVCWRNYQDNIERKLEKAKPSRTLAVNVKYPQKYAPATTKVTLPYISDGFYAVGLSYHSRFEYDNSVMLLNFTDLAAFATQFKTISQDKIKIPLYKKYFNVYTVDAKTGALRPNIKIFSSLGDTKTDINAQALISYEGRNLGENFLSLLAKDYGNNALLPSAFINYNEEEPYKIIINKDRAIYRPEQEIKLAFTVIEKTPSGYTPYSGKDTLAITIASPNGKNIAKADIALDDMGSADYSFKIPKGTLMGRVLVNARFKKVSDISFISLEEYKRPEFEVSLDKNLDAVTYGKPFTVTGKAKYYYGSPVANAKVTYSINKEYFIPWFCWYFPVRQNRQQSIEGKAITDKDGTFKITFTPQEDEDNKTARYSLPQRYNITAFVTDAGGRAIQDSQRYTVSSQEKFFAIKNDKGFFRQDKEGYLTVQMVNADEAPLEGSAKAVIYSAEPIESTEDIFRDMDRLPEFKEGKQVKSFSADFNKEGPSKINIPALKEGFYIIKFITEGSDGKDNEGKFTFMVVNPKNCKLNLPSVTIAEEKVYYPGQTAAVLIGAAKAKGNKYIEIYKDGILLEQKTLPTSGAAILEIPVKKSYEGGISLNWFAAYAMEGFKGSASLEVPYKNASLDLKILGAKDNLPAAKVNWTLEAKDALGKPVNARAVITAYDSSLDYYQKHTLSFPSVYSNKDKYMPQAESSLKNNNNYYAREMVYDAVEMGGGFGAIRSSGIRSSVARSSGMMNKSTLAAAPQALAMEADKEAAFPASAGNGEEPQVTVRENFAETAVWLPRVNITDGVAPIAFTFPQRFTQWTMLAAAFTKDLKTGQTSFTATTKQDLMVRLETPRFLREGDSFELKAIITNNSTAVLPVALELITKLDEDDAKDLLGIVNNTAELRINPGEQSVVSWPIRAPQGSGVFNFTLIAKAAGLSDGEVKSFPLLPATQRLSESKTIAVKDGANTVSLDNLANPNTELNAVHLSIEPSLLMPVLNAMPLLTYDSYQTVTGLLNSYLPLAILNGLYNKYPDFKTAADALPARKTSLPAWDANQEMLLTELSSSPWYTLSKGYQQEAKTINLFDPALVQKQQSKVLAKLKDYQNEDGGFAWIKGGKSSLYITLYSLDIMAQARDFGAQIPEAMVKKALAYAISNTNINVVSPSYDNLTYSLYAAYVLTSFPESWYTFDVKKLVNTADEFGSYMTPMGKAYAAVVCKRVGYDDRAMLYIDRLFDSVKTSPVTGMYWAQEERSWQWYNDTITQHVMAIKALNIINPQDARIKELVKWLMLNRKTDQWSNSEETAKAVYTLLDVMDKNAALSQTKTFNIKWNGEESILEVKPYDSFNPNFTFSRYEGKAKQEGLNAVITKTVNTKGSKQKTSLDDFASLTAVFTSLSAPKQSPEGMLNIRKQLFLVKDKKAIALGENAQINVGDEIQVRLTISCKNPFSFVNIADPKPAAFEADTLLSGWQYDLLARYEEVRDNATNFFMDWLPNGTYELKYTLRPTTPGTYSVGAAVMQSMFAPQFTAHSQGFFITVK